MVWIRQLKGGRLISELLRIGKQLHEVLLVLLRWLYFSVA